MPKCKQCGTNYNILSAYGDGLCKECHKKAITNAEKKEAEQRHQAPQDTKTTIDLIVRAIADDDEPLSFAFVNWNVDEKIGNSLSKFVGLVGGAAMGGTVGKMVFANALLSNNATFSGELGVIVVTETKIFIGHFTAAFFSKAAGIIPEHLQVFLAKCKSNAIHRKLYEIAHTQVSVSENLMSIVNRNDEFLFSKSELTVNNEIYQLPSLAEVYKQISQVGHRVGPNQFVKRLLARENPLLESQVDEAERDRKYMNTVSQMIIMHPQREVLVQNFLSLTPSIRDALEVRLRGNGFVYREKLLKMLVWIFITIGGIALIVLTITEVLSFLSGVSTTGRALVILWFGIGTLFAAIVSIRCGVSLSQSAWCRKIYCLRKVPKGSET